MQTSYEVGAVLRLIDEASPVLRLLSEKMEAFDKLVAGTQKSISRLGSTKVGELGSSITSVAEKLGKIGSGAEGAANKIRSAFQGIDASATEASRKMVGFENAVKAIGENSAASFGAVATNVGKADGALSKAADLARTLKEELQGAGIASREIPRLPSIGGGGGGRGGSGGGGHGGGSHGHEGHGRIQTKHGERPNETGPHGAFIDAGVVGTIGFHEVAHSVERLIEAGATLEKFQAQLYAATGSMATVAQATAAAWDESAKNLTTSVSENLKNLHHLMNVTGGGIDEAQKLLHPFTMADTALGSIKDESIAGGKGSKALEMNTYNFARSLEQLGVTNDEEKLQSYTANLTRMMIGMRGLVDGSKLFQGINNAGGSRYAWNEDFVTYGLGPLLQATNGRAGAQLYQLNRSMYQGVSTEMMAKGAEKYGLWNEEDENWVGGKFKGMKVGSVFEADKLMHDPVAWAGDVREMMKKRGIDVDNTDVMTKVIAESTRGNKNLGAIMDELILPNTYQALMKERKNIEAVPKDAVEILQKHDPGVAMKAFNEQFESLLAALGKPTIGQVADTLNKMAASMNGLARWFDANPEYAKAFTGAMAGIAAGLAALAVVGLAAFAPGGIAVVALVTFAGAMSGVAAVNWDKVQSAAGSIGLSMDNFHKNISDISGAFDSINKVLTSFFTGLVSAIKAIPVVGKMFGAEQEPNANRNGAPLTPEQKAWMETHPGLGIPDDLAPSTLRSYRQGSEAFGPKMPQMFGPAMPRVAPPAAPSGIDPSTPGFVPISLVTGANDNVKKTSETFDTLKDRTGLINASFDGLNGKTGFVNASFDGLNTKSDEVTAKFTDVGKGSEGFKNALDILTATAIGAARALAQVALAGGFGAGGGGNGIINASWGGGGGGGSWNGNALAVGSGFGGGSWAQSGATRPEVAEYIKAQAAKLGIDPNVALRVSQSEGFNSYTGDYGTSFGPFQLHYGGSGIRGMNSGGLGDAFTRVTGLDARDPKTWKAQVDFALKNAKQGGWSPWHGAAHVGIGNRQGLDYHGPVPTASAPPKKVTPGVPATDKPMVSAQNDAPQHHHIYLDGKKIAQVVTKHQATAMRFPRDMGGPDAHGTFVSPGTPVSDAA